MEGGGKPQRANVKGNEKGKDESFVEIQPGNASRLRKFCFIFIAGGVFFLCKYHSTHTV